MRLLTVGNMYPPQSLGGYEVVWAGAVDHLRAQGHDVTVLTTDISLRDQAEPDAADVHRELRWHWDGRDHDFVPAGVRSAFGVQRHNAAVLRRHLASGPDAVIWWAMGGMSLGLIAQAGATGTPAGAVVHDFWPIYGPRVDAWLNTPRAVRLAARGVGLPDRFAPEAIAAWSFNSAWQRDGVLTQLPEIDGSRCGVAYPGIDADRFAAPEPAHWRWRLACVGRVESRKGLAVAIEALGALPAEAHLTIAGGGDDAYRRELEELAARLGCSDRVVFTGAMADVAGVYAEADAVLFPVTWDEPFGLVPLEAMAAGRPVVATGTGGSAEYLRDGDNCLLSIPGDPGALAAAVQQLAGDASLRGRLVAAGHATAARFPVRAFNEAMEEFVEAVVATGGARGGRAGR